jgi:hypothetical protein
MENTTVCLRASDGRLTLTFVPALSTEQYAELVRIASNSLLNKADVCEELAALAALWKVEFRSRGTCDQDSPVWASRE